MRRADSLAVSAARRYQRGASLGLPELVVRAVVAYEEASKLMPEDPEPHYRAAELLYAHFVDKVQRPPVAETERAIGHWKRYETLSPKDPRMSWVLFRRSIAYTKLGGKSNFLLAIQDYEAQLQVLGAITEQSASNAALVLGNAAELHMAVGSLTRAITLYKRALRHEDRPLLGFGLSLALWRYGQQEKALQTMRRYARKNTLALLTSDGVFFVPEGEIEAYRALGYEAMGQTKSAVAHYRRFIAQRDGSPEAEQVRSHLRRLRPRKRRAP